MTRRYRETHPKLVGKPPLEEFVQSPPGWIDRNRQKGDKSNMGRNNKSVLVVDDDRDLRYLLSVRLVSAGYMVYGAANGLEALEQMEKHSIGVVLTDYHMPKMDGFEFLSVRRMKWPGTPVVVFSAEQDDLAHEA
ncbi:MAG TPA: response regulator, partial [Nitrospiraceae bacterium]|nr:response regulator [Nitrospiraceae bacterium]